MLTLIEFYDKDVIKNILAPITLRPDKVVFLYDEEIKNRYFYYSLRDCFRAHMPDIIIEIVAVNSMNMNDVYYKTKKIIEDNENCIMELTGGSELMIIGGYKAGIEANIEIVYSDILKGEILGLNRDKKVSASKLYLSDFLTARGACVLGNSHLAPKQSDFKRVLDMSKVIFESLGAWKNTCSYMQIVCANSEEAGLCVDEKEFIHRRDGRKIYLDDKLMNSFYNHGFINGYKLSNGNVRFSFADSWSRQVLINFGVWLEMFVYINAKNAGIFEDVMLGAMIDWNAYDGIAIQGNEIDVILCDNSMPVFISCKLRGADTAALNELMVAKKRLGGWFSKGVIVAFGDDKKNNTGTYKRAKELRLELLDKDDIMSNDFVKRLVKCVKGQDLVKLKWN